MRRNQVYNKKSAGKTYIPNSKDNANQEKKLASKKKSFDSSDYVSSQSSESKVGSIQHSVKKNLDFNNRSSKDVTKDVKQLSKKMKVESSPSTLSSVSTIMNDGDGAKSVNAVQDATLNDSHDVQVTSSDEVSMINGDKSQELSRKSFP